MQQAMPSSSVAHGFFPATILQITTLQAVNQQLKARASSLAGLQVEAGQLQPQVDKVTHLEEVLAKLRSKAAKLPGLQEEAEALRGPVMQVSFSLQVLGAGSLGADSRLVQVDD